MKLRLPHNAAFILFCSGLLVLAGSVLHGDQSGHYTPNNLGSFQQPAPQALNQDGIYAAGSYPLYPPSLEPGEGRDEVEAYCIICHSTRYITMQPPLPAATWDAEVKKMLNAYGAPIPNEAAQKIIPYLEMHYTPETRKR
jgi:hypothetical protein